ncbi:hypothetical protein [Actinomadura sp. 9N407]|uniref:hypothetical protein n=1 Tax=Actinomadura sp. 9N407 TaxID=3375154 RepID=UPI0037ADB9AC
MPRVMILGPQMDATTFVQLLLHDGMVLTAFGAAVLLMVLRRFYEGRPEPAGPDESDPGPDRCTANAGAACRLPNGQGTGRRGPGQEPFNEPRPLGAYAAQLLTTETLIAPSALLERRRTAHP